MTSGPEKTPLNFFISLPENHRAVANFAKGPFAKLVTPFNKF